MEMVNTMRQNEKRPPPVIQMTNASGKLKMGLEPTTPSLRVKCSTN